MPSYKEGAFGTNTLVPEEPLRELEQLLHDLIRARAGELPSFPNLVLPDLFKHLHERYDAATGQAREGLDPNEWFPVPGMSGGFSFSFQKLGLEPELMVESWCRVVGGSGQRHKLSLQGGCELIDEGF